MPAEAREDRLHSNQSSTVWQEEIGCEFPLRERMSLTKFSLERTQSRDSNQHPWRARWPFTVRTRALFWKMRCAADSDQAMRTFVRGL